MNLNIRNKRKIAFETSLVFLLWLASIVISYPVFNRPLDEQHEWLSATTLVSLESFETYGFWTVLGTSLKGPFCFEFFDTDPRSLPFIYSQHPSLWLILPYIFLKLSDFLGFSMAVSVSSLQIYNLLFTRLISSICVYFIFKKLSFKFIRAYKEKQLAIVSFVSTFFWLFSPPVLYWTQNVYHEDQAHLTPSLILILIALCLNFRFDDLSFVQKLLLFLVAFVVCFSSYYGWVLIPSIVAASIINSYKSKRIIDIITSLQPIMFGFFAAVVAYVAQIVYLDTLSHTLYKFSVRTGISSSLSLKEAFSQIWYYTTFYFPVRLFKLEENSLLFLLLILSVVAFCLLIYLYVPFKKQALIPLIPIALSPSAYILLLREYVYVHEFAVLKLALPIIFFSVYFPLLIAVNIINELEVERVLERKNSLCVAFMLPLIILIYVCFYVQPQFIWFAREGTNFNQELGILIQNNISTMDLPISDSISVGIHPPQKQFYTKRFVYTLEDMSHLPERQYDIAIPNRL